MLGWAWLAATLVLAAHVVDEAAHDFLSWYNPRATRIRRVLRGLPFPPTFSFWPWLLGLMAAILVLASLTPLAYADVRWIRPLAWILAVEHVANGMLHVVASVVGRRPVPGVWSAPLLLASGGWLAYAVATVD